MNFSSSQRPQLEIVQQKIAKNNDRFKVIFRRFFVNKINFLSLRAWKNYFNIKIILETCSATSNYPWHTISWPWSTYCGAYGRRLQNHVKINEKSVKYYIFGLFWGGFTANPQYTIALQRDCFMTNPLSFGVSCTSWTHS